MAFDSGWLRRRKNEERAQKRTKKKLKKDTSNASPTTPLLHFKTPFLPHKSILLLYKGIILPSPRHQSDIP